MSTRKERGGSIQCHVMLSYRTTARMRAPVDFGEFARLLLRCENRFVAEVLAKKLLIAKDAMDVGGKECNPNSLTLKSCNALQPQISIFYTYCVLVPLPSWETAFERRKI